MNPPEPNDLFRTLAEWRVNPRPDPNFRPAVWQRIKQGTRDTWAAYVQTHLLGWSMAAAIAVVGATFAGHAVARAIADTSSGSRSSWIEQYASRRAFSTGKAMVPTE